jgi:hypothetical protein
MTITAHAEACKASAPVRDKLWSAIAHLSQPTACIAAASRGGRRA